MAQKYVDVATKTAQEDKEFAEQQERIAALEAELQQADYIVEVSHARYRQALRLLNEEEYVPEEPVYVAEVEQVASNADEAERTAEKQGHTEHVTTAPKNAAARTDKQVSCAKWNAARASEERLRHATVRARERIRRCNRDAKRIFGNPPEQEFDEPQKPAETVKEAPPAKPQRRVIEASTLQEGAKGLADRLKSVTARPNQAEKHRALLSIIGGRPRDLMVVIDDIKDRNLIDSVVYDEVEKLLFGPVEVSAPLLPSEWLAHAKEISGIERLDDKPLQESEVSYLAYVEDKEYAAAETALTSAEGKLQTILRRVEETVPAVKAPASPERTVAAEQKVDLDLLDTLDAKTHVSKESKGGKNSAQMTDKQISCEKWVAARASEARERENQKRARELRRAEARDRKLDVAPVD